MPKISISPGSLPASVRGWISGNMGKGIYVGVSALFMVLGDILPFLTPMLQTLAQELPGESEDIIRALAFVTGGLDAFWSALQSVWNFVLGVFSLLWNIVLAVANIFLTVEVSFFTSLVSLIIKFILMIHAILIFLVHLILIIPVIVCAIILAILSLF